MTEFVEGLLEEMQSRFSGNTKCGLISWGSS
jgi:hypothetical protein